MNTGLPVKYNNRWNMNHITSVYIVNLKKLDHSRMYNESGHADNCEGITYMWLFM